ncbi:MAG: hypothetical protein ABL931_21770 [Usitatibacteraceae bacterium]
MTTRIAALLFGVMASAGCAVGAGGIDNALFSNAGQVHIFTPQEQAGSQLAEKPNSGTALIGLARYFE